MINKLKDINEITHQVLEKEGFYLKPFKISTSFHSETILSINKSLKKINYFEDGKIKESYPETFYIKINNEIIVEW